MAANRRVDVLRVLPTQAIAAISRLNLSPRSVSTIVAGTVGLYLLRRRVKLLLGEKLPPSWHPFPNGEAEVILKDRLKYCEDVLFDHENGLAIVSGDPGRAQWNTVMGTMYDPNPKGALFLYNYISKSSLRPIELVGLPSTADFHPLGINFYREKAGGLTRLFVVNHQRNGSTVDIFDLDYDKAQAKFITSISDGDRNILSPNAIAPISYTSFYVTNDHRFIPRLNRAMNQVETHLTLPLSWVTLVDFSQTTPEFTTVAKGIAFSNGIVLTPTGKEVIVASTVGKHLRVYDRDSKTNLLSLREKIPVPFMPDNLSFDDSLEATDKSAFDKEGKFLRGLVSAGHPVPIKLLAVSRNPTKRTAPSWVVEVRRGQGSDPAPTTSMSTSWKGNYHLRTLYQSDGTHFPTSTTGAVDFKRGRMIVSGLYATGLLEVSWKGEEQ